MDKLVQIQKLRLLKHRYTEARNAVLQRHDDGSDEWRLVSDDIVSYIDERLAKCQATMDSLETATSEHRQAETAAVVAAQARAITYVIEKNKEAPKHVPDDDTFFDVPNFLRPVEQ